MNTALKYLTVIAAVVGGCYTLYVHADPKVGAALLFFAGLLTDYAELGTFAINAVKTWKAPNGQGS